MATTITTPTMPTVGGSDGTWGTTVNAAVTTLVANDTALKTTVDGALPLAGGTMTGQLDVKTSTIAGVDKGSVSGAVSLDLSAANYFTMTLSGNTTFSVTNPPDSGLRTVVILDLTNAGAHTITWFATILWPGGSAPTLTSSGRDLLAFFAGDAGGDTWIGWPIALNVS